MYVFASSSATLLTVYTAAMHTRRMNVIPEAELWNYDRSGRVRVVEFSFYYANIAESTICGQIHSRCAGSRGNTIR